MDKGSLDLASAVKRMVASGMSQRAIAKSLDISQSTVSRLAKHDPAVDEPSSLDAFCARWNLPPVHDI